LRGRDRRPEGWEAGRLEGKKSGSKAQGEIKVHGAGPKDQDKRVQGVKGSKGKNKVGNEVRSEKFEA